MIFITQNSETLILNKHLSWQFHMPSRHDCGIETGISSSSLGDFAWLSRNLCTALGCFGCFYISRVGEILQHVGKNLEVLYLSLLPVVPTVSRTSWEPKNRYLFWHIWHIIIPAKTSDSFARICFNRCQYQSRWQLSALRPPGWQGLGTHGIHEGLWRVCELSEPCAASMSAPKKRFVLQRSPLTGGVETRRDTAFLFTTYLTGAEQRKMWTFIPSNACKCFWKSSIHVYPCDTHIHTSTFTLMHTNRQAGRHCIALRCVALHCIQLHSVALCWVALHCILHHITSYQITSYHMTSHDITRHHTALH